MATRLDRLYEDDFVAWTRDQAAALRRLAASRPNEAIDWARLIEEVEDLGKEQRNALRGWTARILERLLLLEHSPATGPRRGWAKEVAGWRREIDRRLSPTLLRDLRTRLPRLYAEARADLARDFGRYGEVAVASRLPEACPYTLEQVLDPDWWPSDPRP